MKTRICPTEIDVPIDNLTPAPPGTSASPAGPFPDVGENPDLPTEIDVPIDNLTPESGAGNSEPLVATPEAIPLSEIERVQNGSFEQGSDAWYLESGAGSSRRPTPPTERTCFRFQRPGVTQIRQSSRFLVQPIN